MDPCVFIHQVAMAYVANKPIFAACLGTFSELNETCF